jgi:mRNA-degrading endonuclease RelE of RelBE toxin-antitoxin system
MSKPTYSIRLHLRARKGLEKLSAGRQQQAREFINSHLRHTPKLYIPGKTKPLSGPLKGIYQYDLSRGDRIWWRIDDEEHVVVILYIGPHPKTTE